MSDAPFCSELARSHDVSPLGTATEAAHWVLIEDPSPWGEAAVEAADWFSDVRKTVARWTDAVPDLRVQLIRREVGTRETPGRIRCFAVRAGARPVVRDWTLDTYRDLASIDVPAALEAPSGEEPAAPLVLTCVNGQRDACCAKWGRPVARAAAEAAPSAAWRTSHLGGHRFAPTVLVLPHGTHYAWLRPDDMPDLIDAHHTGRLYDLDRVRGHVHQPRSVQAADLTLRKQCDVQAIAGVRKKHIESDGPGWRVRMRVECRTRTVYVQRQEREVAFPRSCGSDEAKPDVAWRVTQTDSA